MSSQYDLFLEVKRGENAAQLFGSMHCTGSEVTDENSVCSFCRGQVSDVSYMIQGKTTGAAICYDCATAAYQSMWRADNYHKPEIVGFGKQWQRALTFQALAHDLSTTREYPEGQITCAMYLYDRDLLVDLLESEHAKLEMVGLK